MRWACDACSCRHVQYCCNTPCSIGNTDGIRAHSGSRRQHGQLARALCEQAATPPDALGYQCVFVPPLVVSLQHAVSRRQHRQLARTLCEQAATRPDAPGFRCMFVPPCVFVPPLAVWLQHAASRGHSLQTAGALRHPLSSCVRRLRLNDVVHHLCAICACLDHIAKNHCEIAWCGTPHIPTANGPRTDMPRCTTIYAVLRRYPALHAPRFQHSPGFGIGAVGCRATRRARVAQLRQPRATTLGHQHDQQTTVLCSVLACLSRI